MWFRRNPQTFAFREPREILLHHQSLSSHWEWVYKAVKLWLYHDSWSKIFPRKLYSRRTKWFQTFGRRSNVRSPSARKSVVIIHRYHSRISSESFLIKPRSTEDLLGRCSKTETKRKQAQQRLIYLIKPVIFQHTIQDYCDASWPWCLYVSILLVSTRDDIFRSSIGILFF